jgi:glycosyltransferase involved in cell wall biosynthesis
MTIWIVMIGESLPTDGNTVRLRRVATLCNQCAARGHEVTWWTSTFDHTRKRQRAKTDTSITTKDGVRLKMLYAPSYKRNVSIGRFVNHWLLGRKLRTAIKLEPSPDIILAAWPTIELSVVSVQYGKMHGVPVIIDVRDLWPDIFLPLVSPWLRPALAILLRSLSHKANYAFANCDGLTATSPGYLEWGLGYARRPHGQLDAVFPLGYEKPEPAQAALAQARADLINQGVNPGKLICWFAGVFGATYDLCTVIHAASILQGNGEQALQFVFSGDGENRAEWEKQAAGLGNVIFTGWVDGAKLRCLGDMAAVGLAAYASSAPQGLPNKIFEYMAFGLPVLSSLPGEARSFLDKHRCGLTYEAGSAKSLLAALTTLQANPRMREDYGATGIRLYEQAYSADKLYTKMVDYLEVVASRKSRKPELATI